MARVAEPRGRSGCAVHRRLRLSAALADLNLALVAGPGRLTLTPRSLPDQLDRMLGQHTAGTPTR